MSLSKWKKLGIIAGLAGLCLACAPVASEHQTRYQLSESGSLSPTSSPKQRSILVMQPVAVEGYDTAQMLYVNQQFQLNAFANHVWVSPPAVMLLPLLMQSLESTHYFKAVTSNLNTSNADYRLETALLRLQQNFLMRPSHLDLVLQMTLVHNADGRVLAAHTLHQSIPCPQDTPAGGVVAANLAARHVSTQAAQFVLEQIEGDTKRG